MHMSWYLHTSCVQVPGEAGGEHWLLWKSSKHPVLVVSLASALKGASSGLPTFNGTQVIYGVILKHRCWLSRHGQGQEPALHINSKEVVLMQVRVTAEGTRTRTALLSLPPSSGLTLCVWSTHIQGSGATQ